MLKIKGLKKTFYPGTVHEKKAIKGVELTFADGDFVTVIGGNGAGKSTVLNLIAGVFPADWRLHRARRRGAHHHARVPQSLHAGPGFPGPHARHRCRHDH